MSKNTILSYLSTIIVGYYSHSIVLIIIYSVYHSIYYVVAVYHRRMINITESLSLRQ